MIDAANIAIGDVIEYRGHHVEVIGVPEWEDIEAFGEIAAVGHLVFDGFGLFVESTDKFTIVN